MLKKSLFVVGLVAGLMVSGGQVVAAGKAVVAPAKVVAPSAALEGSWISLGDYVTGVSPGVLTIFREGGVLKAKLAPDGFEPRTVLIVVSADEIKINEPNNTAVIKYVLLGNVLKLQYTNGSKQTFERKGR